jgi:stage III sporulation protein AD
MEITKVIGIAFVAVFIILVLKQYRPEYAIYVSIVSGIMILFFSISKIEIIIDLLKSLANKIDINLNYFSVLLKITGIAYLTEFAFNVCKDAGETAIASKVELAGRILIIALSIPIISTLLETILSLF